MAIWAAGRSTRHKLRSGSVSFSTSAIEIRAPSLKAIDAAVKMNVFSTACQKVGSPSSVE